MSNYIKNSNIKEGTYIATVSSKIIVYISRGRTFSNADNDGNQVCFGVVLQCVVDAVMDMVCDVNLICRSSHQPNRFKLAQFVDNVEWRVVDHIPTVPNHYFIHLHIITTTTPRLKKILPT